jgi:hypothetical protein
MSVTRYFIGGATEEDVGGGRGGGEAEGVEDAAMGEGTVRAGGTGRGDDGRAELRNGSPEYPTRSVEEGETERVIV